MANLKYNSSTISQSKKLTSQDQAFSEFLQLHQLLEKRSDLLNKLNNNDLCYLLSIKWLNDWKTYVDYDTIINEGLKNIKKIKRSRKKPGKINADITALPGQIKNYYSIPEQMVEYQYLNQISSQKKYRETDFCAVTQQIWQIFLKYYEGYTIRRPVQITKGNFYYDGDLLRCNVIFVNFEDENFNSNLKNLNKRNYINFFPKLKMLLCNLWRLQDLLTFFSLYCGIIYDNSNIKIWKGYSNFNINNLIQKLVESIRSNEFSINAKQLTNHKYQSHSLFQYLKSSHILVIQIGSKLHSNLQYDQYTGKCQQCTENKKQLTISCVCHQVVYCDRKCRTNDQSFHFNLCSHAFQSQDDEEYLKQQVDLIPIAGLENIGNTCYMNSIIQSLISINRFRSFFSTNQYLNHINQKQLKENKGMFLHKFAKTIKQLIQIQQSLSPWALKGQINYYLPSFKGDGQNDANDFLVNFINNFNDVLKKPENKAYHQILEPFIGQFYSKVMCPHCKAISQNTEIFLQISLPIKPKNLERNYQYAIIKNFKQIKRGKSRYFSSWKDMKKQLNVDKSFICLTKEPEGIIFINEEFERPDKILKNLKGELLYYKNQFCEAEVKFVCQLITKKKSIIGSKIKSSNGLPFIIGVSDKQKTLGTFWVQLIKQCFSDKKQIVKQAEDIEKSYYSEIQKSIIEQSIIANENQVLEKYIAEDKQSQRCNEIVQDYNKRLKIFIQKLGIQVYIHDFKRTRGICKFCKNNCSNCNLPIIFDKPFQDFFQDKYNQVKFEIYLKDSFEINFNYDNKFRNGDPSIHDCLQLFAQPEELDQDNAYYCQKCDSMGLALKQLHVKTFPQILILHLNRFKSIEEKKVKNNDPITYNQIEYFMNRQYRLISSIIHEGSMEAGHYWCISNRNNQYYIFNDSKVTKAQDYYHKNAYILIYQLLRQ